MNFVSKGQKTPDRVHWDIHSLVSNHNTTCVCQQQAMIPNSERKGTQAPDYHSKVHPLPPSK